MENWDEDEQLLQKKKYSEKKSTNTAETLADPFIQK